MVDTANILAEHYQKTYELTLELWKQRNQTFLTMLGVIAASTILTFSPAASNPLLVRWVAKSFGITDGEGIKQLASSFPFGLLQTLLLLLVFYLVVNLYHRALYVLRNYRYLAALEREIREQLALPGTAIAFTREGEFYWSDRAIFQTAVKWCYIVLIGILLFAFLGGRIWQDFRTRSVIQVLADLVVAVPTAIFFIAYARSSVSLDSAKRVLLRSTDGESDKGRAPE